MNYSIYDKINSAIISILYIRGLSQKKEIMHKIFFSLMALFFFLSCKTQPANPSSEQKIKFSGYTWTVRNTLKKEGPGPNYFETGNVRVDKNGYLHLFIKKDSASGEWSAAEVTSDNLFGYGTYQFV